MTANQELITTIFVSVLGGGGLLEIIKYFFQRHDERKNNKYTLKQSVTEIRKNVAELKNEVAELTEDDGALLHDRIWALFNEMKDKETLTVEDRANIDYLWGRYSKRGFNHKAELMYEKICEIPVQIKED